ncbi:MAG: monovalent cation/H+ antiporter subunit D family protein [Hyphomonadaceae bacterium]
MSVFDTLYVAPPALSAQAPILAIAGPLIGACAAALSPGGRSCWMISVVAAAFALWMSLAVACDVARQGVVLYVIGGFQPPLGIALRIDALGSAMALLVSSMGLIGAIYSGHALASEVRAETHTLFQSGYLLCIAGFLGLVSTGDAFNAFVFLEVSSIGTYALVAAGEQRDRRALPAAFNYLIMGTIGATFYVIGIGFLYGATGTLNMADMAARLSTLGDNTAVQAGFAFVVVGLGIKAAIFPLHGWLPGAYAGAPSLVSVFLAATATKTALYLIARFTFDVFPDTSAFGQMFIHFVLAPLAAAAVIVCSVQAIFENEVRRMLAFSSVAQVGLIVLGLSLANAAGASASVFYIFAHALMKAALFMALGALAISVKARTLDEFAGIARDAPWSAVAFGIAAASLAGLPLTMGFIAKWNLIAAAWQGGMTWMVIVVAVGSALTLVYVWRMVEAMFFKAPQPGAPRAREAPVGVLAPLWVLAGLSLWFGVNASLPEALAKSAAAALFGAAP